MIRLYLIGGVAAAAAALVSVILWQANTITALNSEVKRLELLYGSCLSRVDNIIEEADSDATALDPDFTIPPSWLVPVPD